MTKNQNNQKQERFYEVLSIREIETLLKKAKEKSKKAHNGKIKKYSTICLHYKDVGFTNESGNQLFLYEVL